MLLKEFRAYCERQGLGKPTIDKYCAKLQSFLEDGYSEEDLKGAVDRLMEQYSKGGSDYDPLDAGYTHAALQKLKAYLQEPYTKNFLISYEKGFASFAPRAKYVQFYQICNGVLTLSYYKGHTPYKEIVKDIPKSHYHQLIDLLIKYKDDLCASDTAIRTEHGPIASYRYFLDDAHQGNNCVSLFQKKKTDTGLTAAEIEYRQWWRKLGIRV